MTDRTFHLDSDGVRRPAPRRDAEDDQHRAASKQLAGIIDRYGVARVDVGNPADLADPTKYQCVAADPWELDSIESNCGREVA